MLAVISAIWALLMAYYTLVFFDTSNYDSYGCDPDRDAWFVVLAAVGAVSSVGALVATSGRPQAVWVFLAVVALATILWLARGGFAAYDCALGI